MKLVKLSPDSNFDLHLAVVYLNRGEEHSLLCTTCLSLAAIREKSSFRLLYRGAGWGGGVVGGDHSLLFVLLSPSLLF